MSIDVTSTTLTGAVTGTVLGGLTAVATRQSGAALVAASGGVALGALAATAGKASGRGLENPSVHIPAAAAAMLSLAGGVLHMSDVGRRPTNVAGTAAAMVAAALGAYTITQGGLALAGEGS